MSKVQLTERQKLERDLRELIALHEAHGSPQWEPLLRKWIKRKFQLTEQELKQRHQRHLAMGSPPLDSPEWQAELQRLSKSRRGKQPIAPTGTDPNDTRSLYWPLLLLASCQSAGAPVELIKVPGQSHYRQTSKQRAEARRMYRWLWRNFPGQLCACGPELRKLIRRAGWIA